MPTKPQCIRDLLVAFQTTAPLSFDEIVGHSRDPDLDRKIAKWYEKRTLRDVAKCSLAEFPGDPAGALIFVSSRASSVFGVSLLIRALAKLPWWEDSVASLLYVFCPFRNFETSKMHTEQISRMHETFAWYSALQTRAVFGGLCQLTKPSAWLDDADIWRVERSLELFWRDRASER